MKSPFVKQQCRIVKQQYPFAKQQCRIVKQQCPFAKQQCRIIKQQCRIVKQQCPFVKQQCRNSLESDHESVHRTVKKDKHISNPDFAHVRILFQAKNTIFW